LPDTPHSPSRVARLLRARQPELRYALSATLAGLAAHFMTDLLQLTQGYWSVLTAVLVVQVTVGASVKAATERLAATVLGGACGFLAAYAVHRGLIDDIPALIVVLLLLSLLAGFRPAFRLAPVTAAIVLLVDPTHTQALETALHRMLNIALGCLVGLAVALLVLPARAHADLAQQAARLLRLLGEAMGSALSSLGSQRDEAAHLALNNRIRAALSAAETRGQEAKQERSAFLTDAVAPDALLRTLRRLRADQIAIGRATARLWPQVLQDRLGAALAAVGTALAGHFAALAEAAAARRQPPSRETVSLALDGYARALQSCRDDQILRGLPTEAVSSLYALSFAFEQVRGELELIEARLAELAVPPSHWWSLRLHRPKLPPARARGSLSDTGTGPPDRRCSTVHSDQRRQRMAGQQGKTGSPGKGGGGKGTERSGPTPQRGSQGERGGEHGEEFGEQGGEQGQEFGETGGEQGGERGGKSRKR
jgi:hypothetical protein